MSYHYHTNGKNITVSGHRLIEFGHKHGMIATMRNMGLLAQAFMKEHKGTHAEPNWHDLSLKIHLGWTPEHKGMKGIKDRFHAFDTIVDAGDYQITDDYGVKQTVTIV